MGCNSCSNNDGSGTPAGCKNNGACGNSGCNKLAVFDWLANMELPIGQKAFDIVEVRFKNSRKQFFKNSTGLQLFAGDVIAVEGGPGVDVGIVSLEGELVKLQLNRKEVSLQSPDIKKVLRKATNKDIETWQRARGEEERAMFKAREAASGLNLRMKISDVEYQGDGNKATFYYTADDRVDFRELIKKLADEFKVRIEMRQIGARQEAARLGGIGSCGRELCCATWLNDFRTVTTSAARYQQLSLNPQKLAGQCGKLKCCLNYELDMYLEAVKELPNTDIKLKTKRGSVAHFKTDIFKRIIWYVYEEEHGINPIALKAEEVSRIIAMNKEGNFPADLKEFEYSAPVLASFVPEPDYANVVGQDSLTRFDKKKPNNDRRGGGFKNNNNRNNQNRNDRNAPSRQENAGVQNGEAPKTPDGNKVFNKKRNFNNNNRPKGDERAS